MSRDDDGLSSDVVIEVLEIEAAEPAAERPSAALASSPRSDESPVAGPAPSLVRARGESHREGIRASLRSLLPALDSLESCYREAPDRDSLRQGVRMALRAMWDVFRAHDLERIEGDGVQFDPRFHEAAQVTTTDRVPPGTVLEVLRVGYTLGGELVRPAMVRVAVAPGDAWSREEGRGEER